MAAWWTFNAGRFGTHLIPPRHDVETAYGTMSLHDSGGEDLPAVVLVHGWGGDSVLNWFSAYAPLRDDGWRVVGVDVWGHGRTPASGVFSLPGAAAQVLAATAVIGVRRAVYAGYSMGGPITQEIARQRPGAVAGLVQVATAAHIVPSGVGSALLSGGTRVLGVTAGAFDTLGRLGRRLGSGSAVGHVADVLRIMSKRSVLQAGGALATFDSRPWVGDLGVPATCVVTTRDLVVPPAAQRELAALLGARTLEVRSGHTACLEGGFPATMRWAVSQHRSVTPRRNAVAQR